MQMKKLLLGIGLLVSMTFAGCASDPQEFSAEAGYGYLSLACSATDMEVTRGEVNFTVPETSQFKLTISGVDYTQSWDPMSSFVSTENRLVAGDYTATVEWGDPTTEGENVPAYTGSTPFTILSQQVTEATIKASLTKGLVTVAFTENFLSYFHDEQAILKTAAGNEFEFDSTTTDKAVFVLPGEFTISGKALKQTGEEFSFTTQKLVAKANTLKPYTFDLKSAGTAVIVIKLDETVVEEITVSTELNPES
jgi:hypothetical protein